MVDKYFLIDAKIEKKMWKNIRGKYVIIEIKIV